MGNEVAKPIQEKEDVPQSTSSPLHPQDGILTGTVPTLPVSSMMKSTSSYGRVCNASGIKDGDQRRKDSTIQQMDNRIRKRVRRGITYNMKLIIRGAHGSGKTSLFQRLKGEPIPIEHVRTKEIQTASTTNWKFNKMTEDNVKVEIWDIVDHGYTEEVHVDGDPSTKHLHLETDTHHGSVVTDLSSTSALPGKHKVAFVDAQCIDVYRETNGVVFVMDITKSSNLEYVKNELEKVPTHIPTLVIGTFRDLGHKRKIFKEDVHELLYGSSRSKISSRPTELHYFECSLLNCYGLQVLHQYLSIPFLHLKLTTLRQQIRIIEGDLSKCKNDMHVAIAEQRYTDFLEHVRSTGADIHTGRTGRSRNPPVSLPLPRPVRHDAIPLQRLEESTASPCNSVANERARSQEICQTMSSTSVVADTIVVAVNNKITLPSSSSNHQDDVKCEGAYVKVIESISTDEIDLPDRESSIVRQPTLKIVHAKPTNAMVDSHSSKDCVMSAPVAVSAPFAENIRKEIEEKTFAVKEVKQAKAPVVLEDFTVQKIASDHFYSSEEESDNGENDIVVHYSKPVLSRRKSRREGFLYSDSSEDENEDKIKDRRTRSSISANTLAAERINHQANAESIPEDASTTASTKKETDVQKPQEMAKTGHAMINSKEMSLSSPQSTDIDITHSDIQVDNSKEEEDPNCRKNVQSPPHINIVDPPNSQLMALDGNIENHEVMHTEETSISDTEGPVIAEEPVNEPIPVACADKQSYLTTETTEEAIHFLPSLDRKKMDAFFSDHDEESDDAKDPCNNLTPSPMEDPVVLQDISNRATKSPQKKRETQEPEKSSPKAFMSEDVRMAIEIAKKSAFAMMLNEETSHARLGITERSEMPRSSLNLSSSPKKVNTSTQEATNKSQKPKRKFRRHVSTKTAN